MMPKPILKNGLPAQIYKKNLKESDIEMYINIDIALILETISEMKHTLLPSFLLPFIIILRTKITLCPEGNWKVCFCCGCMLARRINTLINQSQMLHLAILQETNQIQPLQQIMKSQNSRFEVYKDKEETSLSKLKESQRIKLCEAEIKLFGNLCSGKEKQWQKNDQILRFYPMFCLVRNIVKVASTNLQEYILLILQKIKRSKDSESNIKLLNQFQILFGEKV